MQQYVASNVEELRDVVEGLETKWQEKQTKVSDVLLCIYRGVLTYTGLWLLAKVVFSSSRAQKGICSSAVSE